MSIRQRPTDEDGYETDAERYLEGGNDYLVVASILALSDIERAQQWIKWECQHQNRHWVVGKLERKIADLGDH